MRVVFRTDASHSIGHGHVRRCLTLAHRLHEQGAGIEFVMRSAPDNLAGLVERSGFRVAGIPSTSADDWKTDSDATMRALEAGAAKPDWLVVDTYRLDHRWETRLRGSTGRVMVIDDLADRTHDCDLLLDQNLVADLDTRYAGKVPEQCGLLLGPRYALLESSYAQLHDTARVRSGAIGRILVSFGGADSDNLAERCLAAFLRIGRTDIALDVAIGAASPHLSAIRKRAAGQPNVEVHVGLVSLAEVLSSADLAIGAAGTTTWERLCLGVPSIVVTVAPNQEPAARELDRRNLIVLLGDAVSVSETMIEGALRKLIDDGLDESWSARCLGVVDGRGAARVAAALTTSASTPLAARPATLDDEMLLLEWANDAETRANAFSPSRISPTTHASWFRERLRNGERCRLYIVETDDAVPVGVVRFERVEDSWEVHYSVAQPFRRRGLARAVLASALRNLKMRAPSASVFGQVKEFNKASRRVFESLGFHESPRSRDGVVAYQIQIASFEPVKAPAALKADANRR